MQPDVDPNQQNQTMLYGRPQIQQTEDGFPQQQIIIIDEKFKPEFNFRYLSFLLFVLGVIVSMISGNVVVEGDMKPYLRLLSESACCLSIILLFSLDAIFYKQKADWQQLNGQPNSSSIIGMSLEIFFAFIVVLFGYLWFIGN